MRKVKHKEEKKKIAQLIYCPAHTQLKASQLKSHALNEVAIGNKRLYHKLQLHVVIISLNYELEQT